MPHDLFAAYAHARAARPDLALAVFRAPETLGRQARAALRGLGLAVRLLSAARLPADPFADNRLPLVADDLGPAPAAGALAALVDRLLYPAWQHGRPFIFLTPRPGDAWWPHRIRSSDLHDDPTTVEVALLTEHAGWLLGQTAVRFAAPAAAARQPPARHAAEAAPRQRPLDRDLDPDQAAAARHPAGPLRVLAPAGSGKTKTLANRILHLTNHGVSPDRILALAFNARAQAELAERLAARGVAGVHARTFHSLGYQIIRATLGWRYAGEDAPRRLRRLLTKAVAGHVDLPRRRDGDPLAPFLAALDRCKRDLPDLTTLAARVGEDEVPFAPIFHDYLQLQARDRFLAFHDMVYLAARLLLRRPRLRAATQAGYTHVLVDEFQDLNAAQLLLLRLLALPQNNLFVVGDDDQMIYGWRGAQIEHILDFPHRYPTAGDVILATNYRSGRAIVEPSRALIGHNARRVAKDIRPAPHAPAGAVDLFAGPDLRAQAERTAEWLAARHAAGAPWASCAVLYRYRAYAFPLVLALEGAGLPHTGVDINELLRTAVAVDLAAYLDLILDPARAPPAAWVRALNRPNRRLTNALVARVTDDGALQRLAADRAQPRWARRSLAAFAETLARLRRLAADPAVTAGALLINLDGEVGLFDYYRVRGRDHPRDASDAGGDEVLLESLFVVAGYDASPTAFRERLAAARHAPAARPPAPEMTGVNLSTIHQAKGKEWDHVVYYHLSAKGHSRAAADLPEERRVAYVAITRARQSLLITTEAGRPSPFVRELFGDPVLADVPARRLRRALRHARRLADGRGFPRPTAPQRAAAADRAARLQHEFDLRAALDPPRRA